MLENKTQTPQNWGTLYFKNDYMLEIPNYKKLYELIDLTDKVDFALEYYRHSDRFGKLLLNREIAENKNRDYDSNTVDAAKRTLAKMEPKDKYKNPIIIEMLLKLAREVNYGLGAVGGNPIFFNGCHWQEVEKELFSNFLSLIFEVSGIDHHISIEEDFQKGIVRQFNAQATLPPLDYNSNVVMINLQNGTFVFDNGNITFKEFDPKDRLMFQLPFKYDAKATAPKFEKFLEEVIPEENARLVIAEYVGYIFAKHLSFEKCMIFLGEGRNGKSVLQEIIVSLLGEENVLSHPISSLADTTGYHRAQLEHKLLNACSEFSLDGAKPDIVKVMASNQPLSVRNIYGDPKIIKNYGRLLFNSNMLSNKDVEQSEGFFRRFLIVEFNQSIPIEKVNPYLRQEIVAEELSGIFNWALEGLKRITAPGAKGFTYSRHIENASCKFKNDSSSVYIFLEECGYESSEKEYTSSTVLYKEYAEYCKDFGYRAVSSRIFLKRIEANKIRVERKKTNNATWVYCTKKMCPPICDAANVTDIIKAIDYEKGNVQSELV